MRIIVAFLFTRSDRVSSPLGSLPARAMNAEACLSLLDACVLPLGFLTIAIRYLSYIDWSYSPMSQESNQLADFLNPLRFLLILLNR